MKVALVSDTHLPRFGRTLPRAAIEGFDAAGISRTLHADDWTDPLAERLPGGAWLVNPGSPTDKRRQATYSWALLTIEARAIASVELVRFTDRPVGRPPGGD